ncbi:hypothetical protein NLJ89_g2037 [Agrocybe chaxingu]|uniref:FAD-binding domain-containing protein n=1 Tax=Agrocybe chaxingu TaxID=84603 RepID=A0A9W8K7D5_9AGAR|nr:hypothetical protein NLJ89_g2037 [Agrocybe chaxingu]
MVHNPRGTFEGPNTTAYQRFLPTGPIAFLPLSPTISSLVWSTKPALAAALLASDPAVLAAMINAAFRLPDVSMKYLHSLVLDFHARGSSISPSTLCEEIRWREQAHAIDQNSAYASTVDKAKVQLGIPPADSESIPPLVTELQPGSAASFPLRYNHAESYLGEGHGARTVLVGDAAHTVHPLAGQGLNIGLGDVQCLSRCIENSLLAGGDIGSYTALLPYAQERYLANHTLMSAMDKLHKLYTTDNQALVWARSVGVEVLNELDSVKAAIMMSAGTQSRSSNGGSPGWNFAGNTVQTLAGVARTAGSVTGILAAALQNLAQTSSMPERTLSAIYTSIYIGILGDLALDDPSLQDILADIMLGGILADFTSFSPPESAPPGSIQICNDDLDRPKAVYGPFHEQELLAFGTPIRRHLDASTKLRLLDEVRTTLRSIALFFHGDTFHVHEPDGKLVGLPDTIQKHKIEIEATRQEITRVSMHLAELIIQISQAREEFDPELNQAVCITLPAYDAARSASIDLLAATIEASLIKLSFLQARTERAFYNHHPRNGTGGKKTIAGAIEAAYSTLKSEEKELKAESNSLDQQLQEYETMLQLVDGGNSGYQQIVNDWTRVKQDTDECLKDLRRLGWTGD